MKYLVVFALVALVAARPDGGDKPRPKPHGPAIFVRPVHKAAQNESYEFKFGIAGMKELNETEVSLWRVVKGEEGPELKETDFDVELKTLSEEEIKEWIEKRKEEHMDENEEDKEGKDDRRPHFKHAIVGHVTVSDVSCEDQGRYLVRYGSKPEPKEEVKKEDDDERRRPHKRYGAFLILVKGCERPKPEEN